jgi:hypothetical protein
MTRGQANLLRAFSIWTIYVWGTRIWTIFQDDHSVGFKAVHAVLAVVSVAFAIAGLIVVSRVRRRQLSAGSVQEPVGASR